MNDTSFADHGLSLLDGNTNDEPAGISATPGPQGPGIIEIRDPQIDVERIMSQIRKNGDRRRTLPPSAAALGRARMARQRKKILASLKELRTRIRDYGMVETHKNGWRARFDLFIKRSIRTLFRRHILQQHRLHLKLHTVLDQLIRYLQDEDVAVRACIDQAERHWQEANDEKNTDSQWGMTKECPSTNSQ